MITARRLFNLLISVPLILTGRLALANPSETGAATGSAQTQTSSVANQNACPPVITKWLADDAKDKTSWGFEYKSEAKVCRSQIQSYRDFLAKKKGGSNFSDSGALLDYLSSQHEKDINPFYKTTLKKCSALPPAEASAAVARFYAAGTKYEAVNSAILDEVAYLDSVLPGERSLSEIECAPVWPGQKARCDSLKSAAQKCKEPTQSERLNDLVQKTKNQLQIIEGLVTAQQNCIRQLATAPGASSGRGLSEATRQKIKDSCDPIGAAIEIQRNEVPWVRGEDFQKIAVKSPARPRNSIFSPTYDLSDETIQKAITAQLDHNRRALKDTYKGNLADFRCLSDPNANQQNCDFEKLRTRLLKLPDLRAAKTADSAQREANTYFEAEKCLLDRHEDRAQTQAIVDSSAEGIAITVATFGIGEVIGGIRVVNAASKAAMAKDALMVGNLGASMALTYPGLKGAYESCSKESQSVIGVTKKADPVKEVACSSASSALSQAKARESNCVLNALLTAPSVLPFIAAVPKVTGLLKARFGASTMAEAETVARSLDSTAGGSTGSSDPARNEQLSKFIETVKTPGKQNRDLDFASTLTIEERIRVAESVRGKPLTSEQKEALKKAHEMGPYDFDPNSPLTRERDKLLRQAGFSARESAILRGNGIAGSWGDEAARNGFMGQTANIPRSNGSRSDATIVGVVERDAYGNAKSVRVAWKENGQEVTKVVNLWEIKIQYKEGQNIFFQRSHGGFSQGEIVGIERGSAGELRYVVEWTEGGNTMSKSVRASEVSHLNPGAAAGGGKNAGAGNGAGGSGNADGGAKPQGDIFEQAASVKPSQDNRIKYSVDRPEIVRIAKAHDQVKDWNTIRYHMSNPRYTQADLDREAMRRIKEVFQMQGNPTLEDLKLELRRRTMKYGADRNPDYQKVAEETSKTLHKIKELIRDMEPRQRGN